MLKQVHPQLGALTSVFNSLGSLPDHLLLYFRNYFRIRDLRAFWAFWDSRLDKGLGWQIP
jgi:hypothetical protein